MAPRFAQKGEGVPMGIYPKPRQCRLFAGRVANVTFFCLLNKSLFSIEENLKLSGFHWRKVEKSGMLLKNLPA